MKALLHRFAGLKALVVGDIMLDHYVWGDATRISPEAPVPVVEIDKDTYTAGGAANVAFNARSLGADVEICGLVGDDEAGKRLQDLFKKNGVRFRSSSFVACGVTTIQKTRVMVQHQQLCRLDREAGPDIYSLTDNARIKNILEAIPASDVVILADYAKGALNSELVAKVMETAHASKRLVSLDPKPGHRLDFQGVDLVTPNRREAIVLAGLEVGRHDPFPAEAVCSAIWKKYRPRHLVVTMGEEGMLLSEAGKITHSIPTLAREVFDVSGAGDTTNAALSLALAAGAGLADAAHLANAAAGVVIGKLGTATVTPDEILAAAHEQQK